MPAARSPRAAPPEFTASSRADTLDAMAREPLDVLVVGGGITGAGVALDAASRGLRVGIVEADDWASGTSSRSSKMIHGGLRYLATGDIGVVRDSLRERRRLQRNAAHLVRPLPMLLPSYGRLPFQRMKLGTGLWLYEALGHRAAAGSIHAWRSLAQTTRLVPGIAIDAPAGGGRLRGAHQYHDGCADDVRLVLAVLRTALARGAMAVNGTRVVRLLRDDVDGRVRGVAVTGDAVDSAAGSRQGELEVEARVVVNATGVWADRTISEGVGGRDASFRVMASKGIHLTVRRDRVGIESGIAFFEQTGNANVFVEPWQDDLAFVGTTDAPYSGDLADPQATDDEVAWLLDKVNQFLRVPLTSDDVLARWAGLRPLVTPTSGVDEDSKDVSRRHLLVDHPGLLTITGGKLTAYRSMAEATVDAAMRQLGRSGRTRTRDLSLDGNRPLPTPAELDALAARLRIDRADVRHLIRRHGTNVAAIAELVDIDATLADRLHPDRPYIAAEAAWAVSHEQARDVEDILARRTRITLEVPDPERAAGAVASRMRDTVGAG